MSEFWQKPYVNLFKHYGVGQWKKCHKEGEVTSYMDRIIKGPAYRITGTVPANNYIAIPKHNSQSAGLVGKNLYIMLRPLPSQYFTIHLEAVTTCGVIVRLSISNLYKSFKASATWLQFPYSTEPPSKWTMIILELPFILRKYLNKNFSHLKSIKLGANMEVKNVMSSETTYNPKAVELDPHKIDNITNPNNTILPREMRFPVPKGHSWTDFYNLVRFSAENADFTSSSCIMPTSINPKSLILSRPFSKRGDPKKGNSYSELPMVFNSSTGPISLNTTSNRTSTKLPPKSASQRIEEDFHNMSLIENVSISEYRKKRSKPEILSSSLTLCSLIKAIGFGPCRDILFSNDCASFYFASGSTIVKQNIETSDQVLYSGHTNKVHSFALNKTEEYLASSQITSPLVRFWSVYTRECIGIIRSFDASCRSLQFSERDDFLLGVVPLKPNSKLVVWDTKLLKIKGDIRYLCHGFTEDVMTKAAFSPHNTARIVGISAKRIHIWKIRNSQLKTCSISRFGGCELKLKDVTWNKAEGEMKNWAFVSTANGSIITVDTARATVLNVMSLHEGEPVCLNSISAHEAFIVVGGNDGTMKVWDPEFKEVILNVEHESSVERTVVSGDGLRLLALTDTNSIGILDANTRVYKTLLRSHTKRITGLAVHPNNGTIATISQDGTVRIWDVESLEELHEVFSPGEHPTSVNYHPTSGCLYVGYSRGTLRVLADGEVTDEHSISSSPITATCILPTGQRLFVADALGTLQVYGASGHYLQPEDCLKHVVAKGGHRAPKAITTRRDGLVIGFAGPTEHCVSVMDSGTLAYIVKMDISAAVSGCLETVYGVYFGTSSSGEMFILTGTGKVLVVGAMSGIVSTVLQPHPQATGPIRVTVGPHHVVSATGNKLHMSGHVDFKEGSSPQHYVTSDITTNMCFSPDGSMLFTCGELINIWKCRTPANRNILNTSVNSVKGVDTSLANGADHHQHLLDTTVTRVREVESPELSPREKAPTPAASPAKTTQDLRLDDSDERSPTVSPHAPEPHPAPAQQPPITPVTDTQSGVSSGTDDSAVVVFPIATDTTDNGVPHALQPLAIRHPLKLSPESLSPGSTEFLGVDPPLSLRHVSVTAPNSVLSANRYLATPGSNGIELTTVIGTEGAEARSNIVWRDTSLFFTIGNIIVMEDLKTSQQQYLIEHTELITTLCASQRYLASASSAHKLQPSLICLWDIKTLELATRLSYHEHEIQCMEFTTDGSYLVSVGSYKENAVVFWDLNTSEIEAAVPAEGHVNAVSCDLNSPYQFVTVGAKVQFWSYNHRNELTFITASVPPQFSRSIGKAVEFTAVTHTPGDTAFVGTSNGFVTLWDTVTPICLLHWNAHHHEITTISHGDSQLVTGGVDKTLKLWKIEEKVEANPSIIYETELELDAAIVSLVMNESLKLGIANTTHGSLWYVNWADVTSIRLVGGHPNDVNDIALSPTSNHFVTACEDGGLRIWNDEPLEQTLQFSVLDASCTTVTFKPNSCNVIAAGYSDGTVRVFDLLEVVMKSKMAPHKTRISQLSYSNGGEVLVSGDGLGLVSVINASTGLVVRIMSDHKNPDKAHVSALDFSILTPHWLIATADRRISIWRSNWVTDECKMVTWLSFPAPGFTPEGQKAFHKPYPHLPPSLAKFSPLEHNIVLYTGYGLNQEVIFYDLKQKTTVRTIDLVHWATSLDIIPNSNLIVIGTNDRLVKVVDYVAGTFQDNVAHHDTVTLAKYWEHRNVLFTAARNALARWTIHV